MKALSDVMVRTVLTSGQMAKRRCVGSFFLSIAQSNFANNSGARPDDGIKLWI